MKILNNYNVSVPELGDLPSITQVSDALEAIEESIAGNVEFMDAVISGTEILLTSDSRNTKRLRYYNGMAIQFTAKIAIAKDTVHTVKVDNLVSQPASIPFNVGTNESLMLIYISGGFVAKYFTVAKSDSVTSNDQVIVASSKAVKTAYDRAVVGVNKADSAQAKADSAYNLAASCPHWIGDYWITENTTHPATRWPGTAWIKLEGKVLLGTSNGYALGTQGGGSTVALTLANMASHSHGFSGTTNTKGDHYHQGGNHRHVVDSHAHTQPAHTHAMVVKSQAGSGGAQGVQMAEGNNSTFSLGSTGSAGGENTGGSSPYTNYQNPNTSATGNHNHTVSGTTGSNGSGSAFNIMNPYRVVNIWRRTA